MYPACPNLNWFKRSFLDIFVDYREDSVMADVSIQAHDRPGLGRAPERCRASREPAHGGSSRRTLTNGSACKKSPPQAKRLKETKRE